jgi:hypothetical protein
LPKQGLFLDNCGMGIQRIKLVVIDLKSDVRRHE